MGNWFVALPLPPEAGWQLHQEGLPQGLQRLHPLDLHLTLAFLGPCGEERALAAWHALAALHSPALRITAGPWLALGPSRHPSAYGLGLAGGQTALNALITRWRPLALQAAQRPPDPRPPLPHITLARPRRSRPEEISDWLSSAPRPSAAAQLEELALYRWSSTRQVPGEPHFQIVRRRRLEGAEADPQLDAEV